MGELCDEITLGFRSGDEELEWNEVARGRWDVDSINVRDGIEATVISLKGQVKFTNTCDRNTLAANTFDSSRCYLLLRD